ncbi:YhfK [Schleiferilactobacillus shenzhenensis LY-73]|uniref:YhfK n=1 Tax=Schleiferilactobacillus shenzhenensis LY-73 TaxID=1231336 RepID=U4TKZ7_9LACO|nr:YhfK [Schleiferilactobacillus shenzhenensis LY-73]
MITVKAFVIGAHGQIGQILVQKLLDRGDTVTGGYRRPDQQAPAAAPGFQAVTLDLSESIDQLAALLAGQDAVVFAAGSRGKDLLRVDLDGAIKAERATEQAGIKRFVMVSALNAEQPTTWPAALYDYYIAKYYADEWLKRNTDLDYVIIQPAALTNEAGQGTVTLDPGRQGSIPRADVAETIAAVLHGSAHRTTIKLASGPTPIGEAIN